MMLQKYYQDKHIHDFHSWPVCLFINILVKVLVACVLANVGKKSELELATGHGHAKIIAIIQTRAKILAMTHFFVMVGFGHHPNTSFSSNTNICKAWQIRVECHIDTDMYWIVILMLYP